MLPGFAVALPQDALLQSSPPFDYPGVSMRIFPLRADMTVVQTLVDGWLNDILPRELAYFRVFSPFVMLVALHYGRASVVPSNLGWSSQKEMTFSIPLQWYRRTRRGMELHDIAYLTPFIFVDNDLSVPAGREVFGWQKNTIWMESLSDRWMTQTRAPTRHAGIATRSFRQAYAGKQAEPMPFVAIEEAPHGAWLQYPTDKLNPLLPWVSLYNSMGAAIELSRDVTSLLTGLGFVRERELSRRDGRRGILDTGPASAIATVRRMLRSIDPYRPNMRTNEINLKQFRDAERPTRACYQDVNCTVMRVKEINRMGLLGEGRSLAGDITGGYRITLHQWDSLPIADLLGLEGKRGDEAGGSTAVRIRPVLPTWAEMDLRYADERYVIGWRGRDGVWSPGPRFEGALKREDGRRTRLRAPAEEKPAEEKKERKRSVAYNTTLGSSSPVLYGPFEMPRATVRVLPLLASEDRLAELCDRALNQPLGAPAGRGAHGVKERGGSSGLTFAPWGTYVYVVVTTANNTYSIDNNVGSWPSLQVRFAVPVRRFLRGEPHGFALYNPFYFMSSTLESVSASEINGVRAMTAQIDSPSSTWLEEDGPLVGRGRDLTVLRALIPPLLDAGEKATVRTILKISQQGDNGRLLPNERLDRRWAPALLRDLEGRPAQAAAGASPGAPRSPSALDVARARALGLLGDQQPFRNVALKQFRDVAHPERACYQALVEVEQRIVELDRLEEIKNSLEVTLYDYPSMPIRETLGLKPRSSGYDEGLRFHRFEAVRPFWGTGMLREEIGRNLAEHRRDTTWEEGAALGPDQAMPFAREPDTAPPELLDLLQRVDLKRPRNLQHLFTLSDPAIAATRAAEDTEGVAAVTKAVVTGAVVAEAGVTEAGMAEAGAAAAFGPARGFAPPEHPDLSSLSQVEPQWVIESLLSREWESRSNPVWLQRKRLLDAATEHARGGFKALTEKAATEIKEILDQRRQVSETPHTDILQAIDTVFLPRFVALAWISAEAQHLNELAHADAPPAAAQAIQASPAGRTPAPFVIDHFGHELDEDHESPGPRPLEVEVESGPPAAPPEAIPQIVDSLYSKNDFEALESEAPGLIGRAETALTQDPALGPLLQDVLTLCGEEARSLVKDYAAKQTASHSRAVKGSAPELFLHFADEAPDPHPRVGGARHPDESLPAALAVEIEKNAESTLAMARAFVYVAWKNASAGSSEQGAQWRSFLAKAVGGVQSAREELLLALAKCWQKPFFCVPRSTAGATDIADDLFPADRAWIDAAQVPWYSPFLSPRAPGRGGGTGQ